MNELNYLLTISKHPRTIQLLQDALEHEKCSPCVVKNGDDESHQKCVSGTDSRVPSEATVKVSGHTVTGRIATKIKEYGKFLVCTLYHKWRVILGGANFCEK